MLDAVWTRGRRLLGFVVVPALSLLTPLLVIPLVARSGGGDAVVAIAVGQSVGFVGALVVSLAWPLTGPVEIARATDGDRLRIYVHSLDSRGLVFVLAAPTSAVVAALLTDGYLASAMLSAIALTANGLTAAWYYAGIGRPRGLLLNEALVRVASAGSAAAALAMGAPIVAYPLLLVGGALVTYVLNSRAVTGAITLPTLGRRAMSTVREQAAATGARLANGAYQAAAVSVVAAVAPAATLTFSAYDRTQKSLLLATQAAVDGVVSWIAAPGAGARRREGVALGVDAGLVALLGAVFYLALPVLVDYMFAGLVLVEEGDRVLASVGLALSVFARAVLSHALVPAGHSGVASRLLTVTSLIGLGVIALGAARFGVPGALGAVVLTEGSFVILGLAIWACRSRPPERLAAPPDVVPGIR